MDKELESFLNRCETRNFKHTNHIIQKNVDEDDYFEIPVEKTPTLEAAGNIIISNLSKAYKKIIESYSESLIDMCEKIDEWNNSSENINNQITEEMADFEYKICIEHLERMISPFVKKIKELSFKEIKNCFLDIKDVSVFMDNKEN